MSLPALEDIADPLDGVVRIETSPREKATPIIMEMMRSVYPHDQVFGEYCTVNDYIDCPPDELYAYLSDTRSLEEWTYSLRGFTPTEEPGLWLAYDRLGSETEIYTRTVANPDARTVDYHCAWDQGKHLWMIYLMRSSTHSWCSTNPVRSCCGRTVITRSMTAIPTPTLHRPNGRYGWVIFGTCSAQAISWS